MKEKTLIKNCKHHGETEFAIENDGTKHQRTRCKKCRSEAVCRRRKTLKTKAINYKGGKCQKCGYNKCESALEFHHLDPSQKEFGIGSGHTKSWSNLQKEIEKCELLCANCHREVHDNQINKI